MPQGPSILRSGVAIIDKVTRSLHFQADVSYRHYVGEDSFGTKTYKPPVTSPPVKLKAIVDWKQKQVRTMTGVLSVTRAIVTLLNVADIVKATAGDGIDDNDIFILPDGTTGEILDMAGFIDAGTTHPVATEVMLG